MTDASHLEKMGRELKCPICLSLLDSAVSLTCNHVFCNCCIQKSMRSGSNCPVCKLPYQRREIRPAPHMDNLVKIYKSMEVDSGLNVFVTQNPMPAKSSDKLNEGNMDVNAGEKHPETVKHETVKVESPLRMKPKVSNRNRQKYSFATNKRVQVPQSPVTESPTQAMNQPGKSKIHSDVDGNSNLPSEHPPSTSNRSPMLPPFFWLREDADKSSQQTDVDNLMGTPSKIPSFSDIKDSGDQVPSKRSPKEELLKKCNNGDLFDSEMFEWTQRACSPELCSTPVKIQVGNSGKYGVNMEGVEAPSSSAFANKKLVTEHLDNVSNPEKNSNGVHKRHSDPCESQMLHNQVSKVRKKGKILPEKKTVRHIKDAQNGSETHNGLIQNPKRYTQPAADYTAKEVHVGSIYTNSLKEIDDAVASQSHVSSDCERGPNKNRRLDYKRKHNSIKRTHRFSSDKIKKQEFDIAKSDPIKEGKNSQNERHENTPSEAKSTNKKSARKACSISQKTISCTTHCKSERCSQMKSGMENKIAENDLCEKDVAYEDVQLEVVAQAEEKNFDVIQEDDDTRNLLRTSKIHFHWDMPALRKHNAISIKCAFCSSTEETEASGEIVHYSEGRPVTEDHSGGAVIHSHKSCMEWAPNVYFEGDKAINLEEELARSRRIKCSLCGEKGAALGCYEKSCRKSFHVPCAKMLQKCRWDNDYFVILCPLHASSNLPCELSTSQVQRQKSNLKRNLHQSQVAFKHSSNNNLWNYGRSSQKLVLCCSGLASIEKETVSEFAKLSGAAISTSWNSSVTHVIASIDENEACKRTLKVLKAILGGKWIVSIKWVQACLKARTLVDETPYEINHDIYGVKNGPYQGRLRLLNKQPKLFAGFKFYFSGDFVPSYKGYLQDLVTAAGGTVLHRKPVAEAHTSDVSNSTIIPTIIVYCIELPNNCDLSNKNTMLEHRRLDAEALASSSGSRVASNLWILNSIAGCELQDL